MMAVQILKDLDFAWAAFHFSEPEKNQKWNGTTNTTFSHICGYFDSEYLTVISPRLWKM